MPICAICSKETSESQTINVQGKSKSAPPMSICASCAEDADRAFQAETENANLPLALLFGLAAAVVASLIWYGLVALTKYELGIVAVGVGWLVGQAVVRGSGGKRGPILQAASVFFTLLAMAFSEYLVVRYFIIEAWGAQSSDVPLLLPLGDILSLIVEGIKASPLTLLFWAIALWQAFAIPAPRRLRRSA